MADQGFVIVNRSAIMMAFLDFCSHFGQRFSVFRSTPRLVGPYSPILQTSFSIVSDFSFSKLLLSSLKTALGGFYCSVLLRVVSFAHFPSLVRLFSSSPVYLFLFWILWVPGGHYLSPLPHFFSWNSIGRTLAVGSYFSDLRVIRVCLAGIPPLFHLFNLLIFAQSCVLPLGPIVLLVYT